jgi:hypothetical protein
MRSILRVVFNEWLAMRFRQRWVQRRECATQAR